MTKNVWIKVTGYHSVDGEDQEPVVTESKGTYSRQGGKHYLRYVEVSPETGHASKTLVKCTDGFMEVTRKGAVDTRMRFEVGKAYTAHYNTPAGDLEIDAEAHAVTVTEEPRRIVIAAEYSLHAMGECLQNSRVEISVIPLPII